MVLIDLRESEELARNRKIPQAVHATRGMLEFYADPTLPYHMPAFDRNKQFILHCASAGRSALAAATLKQMGYDSVSRIDVSMMAWKEAGLPTE